MQEELPQLTPYFSSGSLVESTLNMGLPAPIDVQIAGFESAGQLQARRSISRARSARSEAWPTSSSRRIWISPR